MPPTAIGALPARKQLIGEQSSAVSWPTNRIRVRAVAGVVNHPLASRSALYGLATGLGVINLTRKLAVLSKPPSPPGPLLRWSVLTTTRATARMTILAQVDCLRSQGDLWCHLCVILPTVGSSPRASRERTNDKRPLRGGGEGVIAHQDAGEASTRP